MIKEKETRAGVLQDRRNWASAAFIIIMMGGMILFLSTYPIPEENRDLIVSMLSIFTGGATLALNRLMGNSRDEEEKKELKRKIADLEKRLAEETSARKALENKLELVMKEIISKTNLKIED